MYDRRAFYVDNHDGDTVTVVLDQGFFDMKRINLRLANVWAPELKEEGGAEVRAFVSSWFNERMKNKTITWPFIVHTQMNQKELEVKTFDRYVATVMSADGTESLNSDVMKFIVDRGYSGGTGAPKPQGSKNA